MDEEMQFTITCGFSTLTICNFGWHNPVLISKRLESEGNVNDGNPFDDSRWNHLCSSFPAGKLHFSFGGLSPSVCQWSSWQLFLGWRKDPGVRQTLGVSVWFNYFLHSNACTASVTSSKIELFVQACFNVHELNLVITLALFLDLKQTLVGPLETFYCQCLPASSKL